MFQAQSSVMDDKKTVSSETESEQETSVDTSVSGEERRPRTSEDFYKFCTTVLQYENYEALKQEDIRNESNQSPPLDSSGSSVASESTSSGQKDKQSEDEDSDSFNLITCFCGKPFAGRPMIECLECLTWIHLSCARIKKTNIPEVFLCAICKKKRRSASPSSPSDKSMKRQRRSS